MSLISFYMKSLGQRSAGKPHAALDVAGAGNVLLAVARQFSTLPERRSREIVRLRTASYSTAHGERFYIPHGDYGLV